MASASLRVVDLAADMVIHKESCSAICDPFKVKRACPYTTLREDIPQP